MEARSEAELKFWKLRGRQKVQDTRNETLGKLARRWLLP
jgi:hypothetical protein